MVNLFTLLIIIIINFIFYLKLLKCTFFPFFLRIVKINVPFIKVNKFLISLILNLIYLF